MSENVRMRGTSVAPIVLGIVGGVLDIPSALCVGACYAGVAGSVAHGAAADPNAALAAGGLATAVLAIGVIAGILSIVFGCLSKRSPILAGVMLIISGAMSGLVFFLSVFTALLTIAGGVCSLVGGILALVQEKEPA